MRELGSTVCFLVSESLEPPGVLALSPACPWPPPCPCLPASRPLIVRQSSTCFRNVGPAPLTGLRVLAPPTSSGAWACGGPWTCGLRASIFCHSGCRLPDFAATLGIPLCCLVGNREVGRREIKNRYSPPFLRVSPRESGLWGLFCMWLTFQTAGALEILHIRSQRPTALFMCVLYSHSQRVQSA